MTKDEINKAMKELKKCKIKDFSWKLIMESLKKLRDMKENKEQQ